MRKLFSDVLITMGALGAICILLASSPQEPFYAEAVHGVGAWVAIGLLWFLSVRGQVK